MTNKETVLEIAKNNSGLLWSSELTKNGIAREYLNILQKEKMIEKIGPGIYVLVGQIPDDMFVFQKKYPSIIFSHETAAYLHGLVTRAPKVFSVTIPRDYKPSLSMKGSQFYYADKPSTAELCERKTMFGNKVLITNLERTIVDLVKNKKRLEGDTLTMALNSYVKRKDKRLDLLYAYAKSQKVEMQVRLIMDLLL